MVALYRIVLLILIISVESSGEFQMTTDSSSEHFVFLNFDDSHEVPLTADMVDHFSPDIYGDTVVWFEQEISSRDIFAYNLQTKEKFQITTAPSIPEHPKIYGDIVVWRDWRNHNSDIFGYDLKTKKEFPIITEPHDQYSPAIYEDIVVWVDERSGTDIYGLNLKTKEEFRITQYRSVASPPDIYGDYVVWVEGSSRSKISCFNLKTQEIIEISANNGESPVIYGDIVVWVEDVFFESGIRAYDLKIGKKFWIERGGGGDAHSPAVYGDIVVWAQSRRFNSDIYGYNLKTEEEFRVTYNPVTQGQPAIYGDYVVWVNFQYGTLIFNQIYGCSLSTLPSPPIPAHSQLTSHETLYIAAAAIVLTAGIVLVLEMKRSPNKER